MDKKEEIEKKIKKIFVILKSLDEKKAKLTDPEEIKKVVRTKSFLIKELKEQKEELSKLEELAKLTVNIKEDENQGAKAFKSHSLTKGEVKKIRYPLIFFLLFYSFLNFALIFQHSFYNSAIIKRTSSEQFATALSNFYFIWKFLIVIAIIYFTVYIINAKYFKYKTLIIYLVYSSLILGFCSYLNIKTNFDLLEFFMAGKGLGAIPGIVGVSATYFLVKNITYIKRKKIIKIKKKED